MVVTQFKYRRGKIHAVGLGITAPMEIAIIRKELLGSEMFQTTKGTVERLNMDQLQAVEELLLVLDEDYNKKVFDAKTRRAVFVVKQLLRR